MSNSIKKLPAGSLVDYASYRPQDLIPAFMDLLYSVDAPEYDQMIVNRAVPAYALEDDSADWWDSESAQFLLDQLFEDLNYYAPNGTYFGAHPGNGSDFGCWDCEDGF